MDFALGVKSKNFFLALGPEYFLPCISPEYFYKQKKELLGFIHHPSQQLLFVNTVLCFSEAP